MHSQATPLQTFDPSDRVRDTVGPDRTPPTRIGSACYGVSVVAFVVFVGCLVLGGPITPARWLGAWCAMVVAMGFASFEERKTVRLRRSQVGKTAPDGSETRREDVTPTILAFERPETTSIGQSEADHAGSS